LRSMASASLGRALAGLCPVAFCLAVVACSSSNRDNGLNVGLGTSSGVSLTSSTGSSTLNEGETLVLTAAVTGDTNNAGVTWLLDGEGSLTSVTSTSATYVAPAAVTGAATPIVTATSIANSAQGAAATLIVNGAPIIEPVVIFPANVGSTYAAAIPVTGGKSPYTWTLTSGTLPDGITLAGNTTYFEALSGTPTTTGSYSFQLTVTDADSRTASTDVTLVVNPAATCLLTGRFAMLASGYSSAAMTTRAASFDIAADGSITGIADRKTGGTTTAAETLSGSCVNRSGNAGELRLNGASTSANFSFAVTTALNDGRVQLASGGSTETATGLLIRQDTGITNLSQLAGSYAFGLQGAEGDGRRLGVVGQLSIDISGTVTAGRTDSNAAAALTAAALTGTMSAPDANGRGTLNLAGGGQNFALAYYAVSATKLLLVGIDAAASAPRLTGFMTRRAATFTNAALTAPGVFTLWGATGNAPPGAVLSVGRLASANATTGTLDLIIDTADREKTSSGISVTGASYAVEADGRASLNFTAAGTARQYTLYLDGIASGYLIERGTANGGAGLLEAQAPGPFSRSMPGLFVSGTQFPQGATPIALLPSVYISGGSISSSSASGFAALNQTTGRGTGNFQITGIGGDTMVLYVVGPAKAIMMRYGSSTQNAAMEWLTN